VAEILEEVKCINCGRGSEACQWCEGQSALDVNAICDCGLVDFGSHIGHCWERDLFKYIIAVTEEESRILRNELRPCPPRDFGQR
jgi:hypothetical protein